MGSPGQPNPESGAPAPAFTTAPAQAHETVVIMSSRHTGRDYRVQVFVPTVEAPPEGYPVIVFTDGAINFRSAADQMMMRQHTDVRAAVIVGLAHPSDDIWDFVRLRSWDLTPDAPVGDFLPHFHQWARGRYTEADAGGAELFYRFIVEEVLPWLPAVAKVNPSDQTLYGHSLGGLFGLHVLLNHPEAFRNYVISSPSIVWNGGAMLDAVPDHRAAVERGEISPRVLVIRGGMERIDGLGDMARQLGAQYVVFPRENHYSVVPMSISRALCFAVYNAGDYPDIED